MARKAVTGRRPRQPKSDNAAASLISALKFISAAQSKKGTTPNQTHCVMSNGMATAFDGVLTIGHPIEDDIAACPNTLLLLNALQKCGEQLSITQLDSGRLAVKSEKFKALVPCEQFATMPHMGCDVRCAVIDNRVKTGLEMVGGLAEEDASRMVLAATLLEANTVTATNGKCLLQYWHGIDLPPNLLLPKAAVKAIVASNKNLAGFGFSSSSATFFFEDGSYIKTVLFEDSYPRVNHFFDRAVNLWPLPEDFFKAVHTLQSFSENRVLYFDGGAMRSDVNPEVGASYEVPGLASGLAFNADYLMLMEMAFHKVDFAKDRATFFSNDETMRGILMACTAR